MKAIRNLLAVIGFFAIVAGVGGWLAFQDFANRLDPEAFRVYREIGGKFMNDLDPGTAFVRVERVKDGLKPEDVAESLKSLAVQYNLLFVGEAPFYKQVEAVTGKPYRYIAFFSFCDAQVGAMMADYNNTYTAFMPCRIALVQDPDGTLWLQMMDLEMLIYGGKPLPPELKASAIKVRETLDKLIRGAAQGEI
ncbi:MAG: DUF302 domain-containing protein [Gammaproteobacteria bacterium]|jgi:hypothetical protein|nr:DUF302 domain-containing protein [Gammaproteobacteria bacterium]